MNDFFSVQTGRLVVVHTQTVEPREFQSFFCVGSVTSCRESIICSLLRIRNSVSLIYSGIPGVWLCIPGVWLSIWHKEDFNHCQINHLIVHFKTSVIKLLKILQLSKCIDSIWKKNEVIVVSISQCQSFLHGSVLKSLFTEWSIRLTFSHCFWISQYSESRNPSRKPAGSLA